MPLAVISEDRKYTRYAHTQDESKYLRSRGLRAVISSNVSAVGADGDVLVVRFHGGATYGYPGQAERYDELVSAASKGKWVWRELRRSGVAYYRMGNVNIADDVADADLMKPSATQPGMAELLLLSTMIPLDEVNNMGIIAGLVFASIINENTSSEREQNKNSRQA